MNSEAGFTHHEACPECPSSDGFARYDDGGGHCFVCNYHVHGGTDMEKPAVAHPSTSKLLQGEYKHLPFRKISEETCRKFGYRVGTYKGKRCQIADYYDAKGRRCAQKLRFADKSFAWVGSPKDAVLFGQQLCRDGGKKIVITEGEIDALTMSQVQGNKWPVVSLKDGAQSWKKSIIPSMEWLESYDEVVLMFDMDEPGQEAALACAEAFTPGKVKIAKLPRKDPNEMLLNGESAALIDAMWGAKAYRPEGIVAGVELIERVLEPPPPSTPYPWHGLNVMLRGQRKGEITTWCGGTGTGKSQIVRELVYNLRKAGEVVGVIALEESIQVAALAQVSLEMGLRLHDPAVRALVTDDAIRSAAEKALDGVYFFEHFGSVEASVLLPKIRYMAKGLGVSYVVLDHISIMVSGTATEGDERKRIDELMTKLRTMVENLGIGLHLVSHLRKANGTPHEEGGRITLDDLRGSGAIKQVSNNIVAAERNQQADTQSERNTTILRVLKCRVFGETGEAAAVQYSHDDGRIRETVVPDDSTDEEAPF